jgi:chromosome partitioning protein
MLTLNSMLARYVATLLADYRDSKVARYHHAHSRTLARKDGTGKTTLAAHLAVMAAEARRVLLLDADPQRSAGDWWRIRKAADVPQLVEADARRVPAVLKAAQRDGVDQVVIDTRPSVEGDTAEIARLADLVLLPVRPGILDLRAIGATGDVIQAVKARATIVLNAVPPSPGFDENGLTTEARRARQAYGLPVSSVAMGNRVALAHALIDGRPSRNSSQPVRCRRAAQAVQ